jgi:hypothetical protein
MFYAEAQQIAYMLPGFRKPSGQRPHPQRKEMGELRVCHGAAGAQFAHLFIFRAGSEISAKYKQKKRLHLTPTGYQATIIIADVEWDG